MVESGYTLDGINMSSQEREIVINELAERMKDIVFMTSKEKIVAVLEQMEGMTFGNDDDITVQYEINFVIGDIIQMVGRERRE
jgi:hypothetical protein